MACLLKYLLLVIVLITQYLTSAMAMSNYRSNHYNQYPQNYYSSNHKLPPSQSMQDYQEEDSNGLPIKDQIIIDTLMALFEQFPPAENKHQPKRSRVIKFFNETLEESLDEYLQNRNSPKIKKFFNSFSNKMNDILVSQEVNLSPYVFEKFSKEAKNLYKNGTTVTQNALEIYNEEQRKRSSQTVFTWNRPLLEILFLQTLRDAESEGDFSYSNSSYSNNSRGSYGGGNSYNNNKDNRSADYKTAKKIIHDFTKIPSNPIANLLSAVNSGLGDLINAQSPLPLIYKHCYTSLTPEGKKKLIKEVRETYDIDFKSLLQQDDPKITAWENLNEKIEWKAAILPWTETKPESQSNNKKQEKKTPVVKETVEKFKDTTQKNAEDAMKKIGDNLANKLKGQMDGLLSNFLGNTGAGNSASNTNPAVSGLGNNLLSGLFK